MTRELGVTRCTVCGLRTHPAEDIAVRIGGERYEVCSDECKASFRSDPEGFVG